MATFSTVNGNILNSRAHALVNPVNCVGTMGAGLGSVDICICNRCAGPFHVIPSAGKHEWP